MSTTKIQQDDERYKSETFRWIKETTYRQKQSDWHRERIETVVKNHQTRISFHRPFRGLNDLRSESQNDPKINQRNAKWNKGPTTCSSPMNSIMMMHFT